MNIKTAHWAIVLQPGKIPVKKRLPKYAAEQVPILKELIVAYPTGLIAVLDACDSEIIVWHPKEVEAMAEQMKKRTTPTIPQPTTQS